MFDVTKFIERNNWTIEDLAARLFGKEHADKLLQNSSVLPQLPSEITNDPGFTIGQKIVGGRAKAKPFGLAGLQYIESKIKV